MLWRALAILSSCDTCLRDTRRRTPRSRHARGHASRSQISEQGASTDLNSGEIIDCNEHHNTCKSDSLNCARGAIRKIVFWLRKIGLGLRKIVFWLRKIGLGLRKMVSDLSPALSPHSLSWRGRSPALLVLWKISRARTSTGTPRPAGPF